jgi:hypothetical protein
MEDMSLSMTLHAKLGRQRRQVRVKVNSSSDVPFYREPTPSWEGVIDNVGFRRRFRLGAKSPIETGCIMCRY